MTCDMLYLSPVDAYIIFVAISKSVLFSTVMSPNMKLPPIFPMRKEKKILDKLNTSFSSEGWKQKEVKSVLLRSYTIKV
jgi:hypothetical protein